MPIRALEFLSRELAINERVEHRGGEVIAHAPNSRVVILWQPASPYTIAFQFRFAPVSWLIERDIVEGRKNMNLSAWDHYSVDQQQTLMSKIVEETKERKVGHGESRTAVRASCSFARAAHASGGAERVGPENPGHAAKSGTITGWPEILGWAAAAVLILIFAATMLVQRSGRRRDIASVQESGLVTEVFDQHVAALAGNLPPKVLSTDRHTVKPRFQGKIPFSFNLPENLPKDTILDGANLTYIGSQPVAQLLYTIGRHRVSLFLREKSSATPDSPFAADHAGFHVTAMDIDSLEIIAVAMSIRLASLN
jgi:anti-sigma factor RsiW